MAEVVSRPALRRSSSRHVGCLLASLSTALVIVLLVAGLITYPLWMPWISKVFSPWPESPSPTSLNLHSVAMVSATDGWAVGDNVILHYTGGQWTQVSDSSSSVLASVAMVSATDGWLVGWDGTILHYGSGT